MRPQVAGSFFNLSTSVNELSVCCRLQVMTRRSVALQQALMVDILVEPLRTIIGKEQLNKVADSPILRFHTVKVRR
jgi:hypothetical protein